MELMNARHRQNVAQKREKTIGVTPTIFKLPHIGIAVNENESNVVAAPSSSKLCRPSLLYRAVYSVDKSFLCAVLNTVTTA